MTMTSRVLLAQQQRSHSAPLLPVPTRWSSETIAIITQCPVDNVASDWPLVYAALVKAGIGDYNTCCAALATIAIETAHTFKPVEEAFWLDDAWRYANLRYAPYWGRGYVQLTWLSNYVYYGRLVGHPEIVTQPAKALESAIAAPLLAAFFKNVGIQNAAAAENWPETRRLVQGGYAGLDEYTAIITALRTA